MDFTKLKRQLMEAKKMAMPRTVIVWGSENLLGKAIESILGAAHNWKVVKIVDGLDVRTLAREVNRLNPEIIFINLGECEGYIPPTRTEDAPERKIVIVNPENNFIEIYSRQVLHLDKTSDLLSIIDEQLEPTKKGGETKAT